MRVVLLRAGIFLMVLTICVVACVVVWDSFVAGPLYQCSDPGALEFLSPGDWVHSEFGDTVRAGWTIHGLWALWYALAILSVVVSSTIALWPWRLWGMPKLRNSQ